MASSPCGTRRQEAWLPHPSRFLVTEWYYIKSPYYPEEVVAREGIVLSNDYKKP